MEQRLLAVIRDDILRPDMPALVRRVEATMAQAASRNRDERRGLEAALREAEQERENIKQAVRPGRATETLLAMLEETEEKIRRLRSQIDAAPHPQAIVRVLPGLVERYARDLRAVLGQDTDRARQLLRGLLGYMVVRPEEGGVFVEVRGNLAAALGVSDNWSGERESNPHPRLGRPELYH